MSQAPNPTQTGGTWTSPNITLAAGQCAYLVVDGFAGDACSYSYSLAPVGASPCDLTTACNVTATPSACNGSNQYAVSGQVTFSNPPATGTLTVTNSCGGSQVFNAPFTSPTNYTINGLTPNGNNCTITSTFSAGSACSANVNYTAPLLPTVPTITTIAPTCSTNGTATITNYNAGLTYVFTPAGPTVGAGGTISGMAIGTSYTVIASNGSCSSTASASFSVLAQLNVPATPIVVITAQPSCLVSTGSIEVVNVLGSTYEYSIDNGLTYQTNPLFTGLLANGTYFVIVRDSSTGCISNSSVSVTLNDVPTPPTISIENGCNGLNYELIAISNSTNVTFEWLNQWGSIIGNQSVVVITTPGTYQVNVNENGCINTEYISVMNVACDIQKGISPNGDDYNDYFDLVNLNVDYLQIFNRHGVQVYDKKGYKNDWFGQTDSGSELPTGTYYYVIELISGEVKTGWIYINRENK